MAEPLCLDLFCKAGGTSRGYQQAGFYVVGVDIEAQPRYIGDDFLQADALEVLRILIGGGCIIGKSGRVYYLADFDLIAASPPCQAYTVAQNASKNATAHPDLVAPVRELLQATGKAYVIENVPGAPLINPFRLCGLSFGLRVRRHRLFEANFFILTPCCQCKNEDYFVIFGNEIRNRRHGQKAGRKNNVHAGRRAMGIDWMTRAELSQAIPPAYTRFIGEQMKQAILEAANV